MNVKPPNVVFRVGVVFLFLLAGGDAGRGVKQVTFQVVTQGNETRISVVIPAALTDFKIDPPSLLTFR